MSHTSAGKTSDEAGAVADEAAAQLAAIRLQISENWPSAGRVFQSKESVDLLLECAQTGQFDRFQKLLAQNRQRTENQVLDFVQKTAEQAQKALVRKTWQREQILRDESARTLIERDCLNVMLMAPLRQLCKAADISVRGTKQQLCDRIMEIIHSDD